MEDKINGWHTDKMFLRHYQNGFRHKEDGPAVTHKEGYRAWYLNGKEVRMEDVLDTPEKREAYLLEESLRKL